MPSRFLLFYHYSIWCNYHFYSVDKQEILRNIIDILSSLPGIDKGFGIAVA